MRLPETPGIRASGGLPIHRQKILTGYCKNNQTSHIACGLPLPYAFRQ
jgi:hypothetical protein